jgi:hypothetical protein
MEPVSKLIRHVADATNSDDLHSAADTIKQGKEAVSDVVSTYTHAFHDRSGDEDFVDRFVDVVNPITEYAHPVQAILDTAGVDIDITDNDIVRGAENVNNQIAEGIRDAGSKVIDVAKDANSALESGWNTIASAISSGSSGKRIISPRAQHENGTHKGGSNGKEQKKRGKR